MNLNDLAIPSRANYRSTFFSVDCIDMCANKKWFLRYPYDVSYQFNSRGWRDSEWPANLKKAIWCVGDSATLGLGSPLEHTWPFVLKKETNTDTINISLDGASNQWIARKALRILLEVSPAIMVIQWSFMHRREVSVIEAAKNLWPVFYKDIKDDTWPDSNSLNDYYKLPSGIREEIENIHKFTVGDRERQVFADPLSDAVTDVNKTINLMRKIEQAKKNTIVVHCHVPGSDASLIPCTDLIDIGEVEFLDYARDGYHYDIKSSTSLVNKIIQVT